MEISVGTVVRSIYGHDSGSFYAVMMLKDGYAYIADGRNRLVEKPKRKNPRHLRATNTIIDTAAATNKQLKKLLWELNFGVGKEEIPTTATEVSSSVEKIAKESV